MTQTKSAGEALVSMPADGIVEGYASTFDRVPDSYGDVVAKGAFARTLREWDERGAQGARIPLLYAHNTDDPAYNIGVVTEAREDDRGLFVRAEFDADSDMAQLVRRQAREGRLCKFSFAYAVRDSAPVDLGDGLVANELRDVDLFEVSLVQIPANSFAEITAVKSGRRNSRKDEGELRRVREMAGQITQIITGLLADDGDEDVEADGPDGEGKAEEPDMAKAEDPSQTDEVKAALVAQAKSLLRDLEH